MGINVLLISALGALETSEVQHKEEIDSRERWRREMIAFEVEHIRTDAIQFAKKHKPMPPFCCVSLYEHSTRQALKQLYYCWYKLITKYYGAK